MIDGIIHPELRDRMILLRGHFGLLHDKGISYRYFSDRFDLAECLVDYRLSVTIHGDDVLSHINWEIGEKWLRRYGFVFLFATQ